MTAEKTLKNDTESSQSASQARTKPLLYTRRYGRNDFRRFCDESARGSHLSIGSECIGDIAIDCKYHWKKSQWGVLGSEANEAGIVYMDIIFHQPSGCSLETANVFITLSEDPSLYALDKRRARSTKLKSRNPKEDYSVQLTNHWGPKYLTGQGTTLSEMKSQRFTPTVGAMGFGFGGIGLENSTTRDLTGRWTFKGHIRKPINCVDFRTLQWELTENKLDPGEARSEEIHTAFTFEHNTRPVFLRVEIDGKLRNRSRNLKYDLVKFSSSLAKHDHSTLTLMHFEDLKFEKNLDDAAKGLNRAMEMENCQNRPLEVPGPSPATFTEQPLLSAQKVEGPAPFALAEEKLSALDGTAKKSGHIEVLKGNPRHGFTTGNTPVHKWETEKLFGILQSQLDDPPVSLQNNGSIQDSHSPQPSEATVKMLFNSDSPSPQGVGVDGGGASKKTFAKNELFTVPTIAMLGFLEFISALLKWFSSLPPGSTSRPKADAGSNRRSRVGDQDNKSHSLLEPTSNPFSSPLGGGLPRISPNTDTERWNAASREI